MPEALPVYLYQRLLKGLAIMAWHCPYCHDALVTEGMSSHDLPCPSCGSPVYDPRLVDPALREKQDWEAMRGIAPGAA